MLWFYSLQVESCELRVAICDFKKKNFTSCEFLYMSFKVILWVAHLFCYLDMKLWVASCFLRDASYKFKEIIFRVESCVLRVESLRR